jgi:predicted ester cyclase
VEAFPDSTIEEKELVAEDDWVLCRTMTEGTHEGESSLGSTRSERRW